jgi:hypothetical protein
MRMRTLLATAAVVFGPWLSESALGDELAERTAIGNEVATLFERGQFSKLETLCAGYRTSRSRTSSGVWNLSVFYGGISHVFNTHRKDPPFWLKAERSANTWVAAHPHSATARLAYATMLVNHGWSIRGTGLANTVEPEDWKPFQDYLHRARAYLEKYKDVASSDPYWYQLMGRIAYSERWPEAEFSALIAQGLEREPLFYQTYFAAIDYYAPKWGGSAMAIERFAREAVERTRAAEGYGIYARIYWWASQTQYSDSLFSESKVDWPTMKKGIDDVLAKYPDQWNINNFARFACIARDKAKAAELIARIDGEPLATVWAEVPGHFQQCKQWASS